MSESEKCSTLADIKVMAALYSLVTEIYMLILLERKYSLFLERGAFLLKDKLTFLGKILFLIVFYFEIFILYTFLSFVLIKILRLMRIYNLKSTYLTFFLFVFFNLYATVDYKVFGYFKGLLNLDIIKSLGGGSVVNSIYYVATEIYDTAPFLLYGFALFLLICFFVNKYSYFIFNIPLGRWLKKINVAIVFVAVIFVLVFSPIIDKSLFVNLNKTFLSKLFLFPVNYLTDFDLDGYGLTSRPQDSSLFDGMVHPYAIDLPGNNIDENGIAGDLPVDGEVPAFEYKGGSFKKNLILVVCESMRNDLAKAKVNGEEVMPFLASVGNDDYALIAHTAFTTPSVTSILTGSQSLFEKKKSLFAIFRERFPGVKLGVFSGQSEAFGNLEKRNSMGLVDVFFDARQGPMAQKMYLGDDDASLKMPAPVVFGAFRDWVASLSASNNFFVYLNFQELHFPYNSKSITNSIVTEKIKRGDISEKSKEFLLLTYYNAARQLDTAIKNVIETVRLHGFDDDTVIIVVGDHGEELYDNGVLGHGTRLSFEQNTSYMNIVNYNLPKEFRILYQKQLPSLIYSIVTNEFGEFESKFQKIYDESIFYVGNVMSPSDIGFVRNGSMIMYNFYEDEFYEQNSFGGDIVEREPNYELIHTWERYQGYIDNLIQ